MKYKIEQFEQIMNEKDSVIRKLKREIEINNERLDVLEKMTSTKDNVIGEIVVNLKKVEEKVDATIAMVDKKLKTVEVKIKKQYEKFTEDCFKVLEVKIDEECMGTGNHEIENEINDFFF